MSMEPNVAGISLIFIVSKLMEESQLANYKTESLQARCCFCACVKPRPPFCRIAPPGGQLPNTPLFHCV